jgi:hypothetical protein
MGSAHVLVASQLRDRLYAEPALRDGLAIVADTPFDDDGTHLLRVISEKLGPGRRGMKAFVIEGGVVGFQKDTDA